MRAAFVIFDGMTALDFVGVYDPLGRLRTMQILPDFEWSVCGMARTIHDDRGLGFIADRPEQSLERFDLLIVPGGFATRQLQANASFIAWLQTANNVPLKASVCTGSLLLGAAGFLNGVPATTHASAFNELRRYTNDIRTDRVVDAGQVVTAGGVTAAIDLGLHLVRRLAGDDMQLKIARQMNYVLPDQW